MAEFARAEAIHTGDVLESGRWGQILCMEVMQLIPRASLVLPEMAAIYYFVP